MEQLFVCYRAQALGKLHSKQRLSHWLVEAIAAVQPNKLKAHSSRRAAVSWAA